MANDDSDIIEGEVVAETDIPSSEPPRQKNEAREPTKKRSKAGWIVAACLLAFIGGAVAFPYMQSGLVAFGLIPAPHTPGQAVQSDTYSDIKADLTADIKGEVTASTDRLQTLLSQMNERLSALEAKPEALPDAGGDTSALTVEVAMLKKQVGVQEKLLLALKSQQAASSEGASSGASAAEVELLTTELESLKKELEETRSSQQKALQNYQKRLTDMEAGSLASNPRGRMYLSLIDLRSRALDGQIVLSDVNGLLHDSRFLAETDLTSPLERFRAWLSDHSQAVMNETSLSTAYENAIRTFSRTRHSADKSFLNSLFTVRDTSDSATGDDALIRDAEKRLKQGDVAGAIKTTEKLVPQAGGAFDDWLVAARHHVAVKEQFDTMLAIIRGTAL